VLVIADIGQRPAVAQSTPTGIGHATAKALQKAGFRVFGPAVAWPLRDSVANVPRLVQNG
jgi:hypothetical protein